MIDANELAWVVVDLAIENRRLRMENEKLEAAVVAAVLMFRALTYGIQIPIGAFTYLIWKVKKDWRREPHDA